MRKIGIVEYGAGNLGNVRRALGRLGKDSLLLDNPDAVPESVYATILPGVGAFGPAMASLAKKGWNEFLVDWAKKGKPLIGICLGMQLLSDSSYENGRHLGLGLIDGHSEKLNLKPLPHMGWNDISTVNDMLEPFDGEYFYFVHSYGLTTSRDSAAMTAAGEITFVSAVQRDSVVGLQFHPERSGDRGLAMLDRILEGLAR